MAEPVSESALIMQPVLLPPFLVRLYTLLTCETSAFQKRFLHQLHFPQVNTMEDKGQTQGWAALSHTASSFVSLQKAEKRV